MPRQKERVTTSIQTTLECSSGRREARISDLSLSGCFVDTIVPICEGEVITFEIAASSGEKIKLTGKSVYQLPNFGFGLHFAELSEQHKAVLEQLIVFHGGNPHSGGDLPSNAKRVIITGDEAATLSLTTQVLQTEGYTVINAENLRETYFQLQSDADFKGAVFGVAENDPQVFGLANYIKTDNRLHHIPVVVITANEIRHPLQDGYALEQVRSRLEAITRYAAAEH